MALMLLGVNLINAIHCLPNTGPYHSIPSAMLAIAAPSTAQ
jgi:hypothetical protein